MSVTARASRRTDPVASDKAAAVPGIEEMDALRRQRQRKRLPGRDPQGAVDPNRHGRPLPVAGQLSVDQTVRPESLHQIDGQLQGRGLARDCGA